MYMFMTTCLQDIFGMPACCMCHKVRLGEQILPWGSLCERTPLGKVLGNLAQAKTMAAHKTLFVLKSSVMNLSPFDSTTVTV